MAGPILSKLLPDSDHDAVERNPWQARGSIVSPQLSLIGIRADSRAVDIRLACAPRHLRGHHVLTLLAAVPSRGGFSVDPQHVVVHVLDTALAFLRGYGAFSTCL